MRRSSLLAAAALLAMSAAVAAPAPLPEPPALWPQPTARRPRRRGLSYSAQLNAWAQRRGPRP